MHVEGRRRGHRRKHPLRDKETRDRAEQGSVVRATIYLAHPTGYARIQICSVAPSGADPFGEYDDMAWAQPQYSRSQVDAAGAFLARTRNPAFDEWDDQQWEELERALA